MSTVATPELALAAAVASPAGTVAISYPTGYVQADFTGGNASGTAYLILNDNDRFEETDDEFDISYGASTVTITNKTGYTWAIGTKLLVALAHANPVDFEQAAAVTNLGGTLTGTTTGSMLNVTAATAATTDTTAASLASTNASITALNLQLKELQTKLNAALTSLRTAGIIAP